MEINQTIPLTTNEGYEYLIKFTLFELDVIPKEVTTKVVNLVIDLLVPTQNYNNSKTLFNISEIINDYLDINDVILYCYCDNVEINKSDKRKTMTNQEYRSLLFTRMFDRRNDNTHINKLILINDPVNDNHYIHLITKIHNHNCVEFLSQEINKLDK
jgi:hypothetical protein